MPESEFDSMLRRMRPQAASSQEALAASSNPTQTFDEFLESRKPVNRLVENSSQSLPPTLPNKGSSTFDNILRQKLPRGAQEQLTAAEPAELKGRAINADTLHEAFAAQGSKVGKEKVVLGNLEEDGYRVVHANLKMGQDAFGMSPDRRTVCVTDGLAGGGKYSGDVARFISNRLTLENDAWEQGFTKTGLDALLNQFLLEWQRSNPGVPLTELSGETTITISRTEEDGSVKILQIGDSPAYVEKKDSSLVSFGDDSVGDFDVSAVIGFEKGQVVCDFDEQKHVHQVTDASRVTLASDWFSDNYQAYTKEYNDVWLTHYEGKYPALKLKQVIPGLSSNFVNEYYTRISMQRQGLCPKFDLFKFKDVDEAAKIDTLMTGVHKKKPDDITVAMFEVDRILGRV